MITTAAARHPTPGESMIGALGAAVVLLTKALARFPSGRAPTADEVAAVATFRAPQCSGPVTGQAVSVNGGLSFGGW